MTDDGGGRPMIHLGSDLRAVLDEWWSRKPRPAFASGILAALAAADEPLTATVEKTPPACPFCHGKMKPGKGHKMGPKTGGPWVVCDDCGAQEPRPGTVRIVAMTEDVLRARLRDWPSLIPLKLNDSEVDAIVRALGFGEAGDE